MITDFAFISLLLGCTPVGIVELLVGIGLLFASARFFGVRNAKMHELRPGEAEKINL